MKYIKHIKSSINKTISEVSWRRVRLGTEIGILVANMLLVSWFYSAAVLPLRESVDSLAQVSDRLNASLVEDLENPHSDE